MDVASVETIKQPTRVARAPSTPTPDANNCNGLIGPGMVKRKTLKGVEHPRLVVKLSANVFLL